jgi:histone H2B
MTSKIPSKPNNNFYLYLKKIIKDRNSQARVKTDVLKNLNDIIISFIDNVAHKVVLLIEHSRHRTITSRDIQTYVRLFFPGELRKQAISQGTIAVTKFTASLESAKQKKQEEKKNQISKRFSSSDKAGLIFSPSRVNNYLRHYVPNYKLDARIGKGCIYYLTAIIEYLMLEIFDLSNALMKKENKQTITWDMVKQVINDDGELSLLFSHLDIMIK